GDLSDLAILRHIDADVTRLVDGPLEDHRTGIVDHGSPYPGELRPVRQRVAGASDVVQLAVGGRPDEDTLLHVSLGICHLGCEGRVALIVDAGPGSTLGKGKLATAGGILVRKVESHDLAGLLDPEEVPGLDIRV